MVSLIICSRNGNISLEQNINIQNTIGVEYELIVIDNSKNKHSITSVYNEGEKKAKYPYLCFMHDDILFHTNNWGKNVIQHFQDSKVGLIGTIGSHFMPKTPIGWYQSKVTSGGGIQRIINHDGYNLETHKDLTYLKDKLSIEAVVVDGLWFCVPKSLFKLVAFDENTFKGFHCYDLDICLQLRRVGYKILIISDIEIEHFSYGSFTEEWVKNSKLFFEKWKDQLPQVAGVNLSLEEMKAREDIVSETFLWMSAYAQCHAELNNVRKSMAYRLGKFILKPFSSFKKVTLKRINIK